MLVRWKNSRGQCTRQKRSDAHVVPLSWVMWGSMVVLIGLMLFSITRGTVSLSLMQVLGALKIVDEPVSAMVSRIVTDLRVPRMLLSVLTGAGLAMVGALLQTTTRNDLADPFLFGLSSGASAGAVLVITVLVID